MSSARCPVARRLCHDLDCPLSHPQFSRRGTRGVAEARREPDEEPDPTLRKSRDGDFGRHALSPPSRSRRGSLHAKTEARPPIARRDKQQRPRRARSARSGVRLGYWVARKRGAGNLQRSATRSACRARVRDRTLASTEDPAAASPFSNFGNQPPSLLARIAFRHALLAESRPQTRDHRSGASEVAAG